MSRFYDLKVKDVRKETDDTVSISLALENGQSEAFQYQAGQYITFKADINGEEVRRSYSLCSSPLEEEWRVAVKLVPGGKFSTYANTTLRPGDRIEAMPPIGNFTHSSDRDSARTYVAFAAGSGITPVISLIKTVLKEEPQSNWILFYGNRTSDSIIFKEELEGLKNQYVDRFSLHYLLSQEKQEVPLFNGRIDREKCEVFGRVFFDVKNVDQFFLCGPEAMITSVKEQLESSGAQADLIKYELFSTPTSKAFVREPEKADREFDPTAEALIKVRIDGDILEFPLSYSGTNILEASIKQGADAPFACKGGVCCTCKAKLIEGEVRMDINYGLEQDEIDAGYILTCQSHPRSEKIVVDYDI